MVWHTHTQAHTQPHTGLPFTLLIRWTPQPAESCGRPPPHFGVLRTEAASACLEAAFQASVAFSLGQTEQRLALAVAGSGSGLGSLGDAGFEDFGSLEEPSLNKLAVLHCKLLHPWCNQSAVKNYSEIGMQFWTATIALEYNCILSEPRVLPTRSKKLQ